MTSRNSFLILSLCILLGCNRLHKDSNLDIVGGNPATWGMGFRRHVVGIADQENGKPHCTATLIAKNAVVTAAHCLKDLQPGGPKDFIYFGKGESGESEKWLPVTQRVTFGEKEFDLSGFFPNYDLAIMRFEGTIPSGFEPAELENSLDNLKSSPDKILIAGYGAQGFRGETESPIYNDELNYVDIKLQNYVDTPLQRAQIQFDQLALGEARTSCFGDSGGPLFVKVGFDKYRLAGVANGTDPRLDHVRPQRCNGGIGLYTFVGNYAQWLSSQGIVFQADPSVRQETERHQATGVNHTSLQSWCNDFGISFEEESALQWLAWESDDVKCESLTGKANSLESLSPNLSFTSPATSLAPFSLLPNLKTLSIRGTEIRPAESLAMVGQVKEINISGGRWTELPDLKGLAQIESLRIIGARLQSQKKFSLPPSLRSLDLTDNNLTMFPELGDIKELRELNLAGNDIAELPNLSGKTGIEILNVSRNRIGSLKGIESYPQLSSLDLSHNLISDWSPLKSMSQLSELAIYGNPKNVEKCPLSGISTCLLSIPEGLHNYYSRGAATAKQDTQLTLMVSDPAKLPPAAKCKIPAGSRIQIKSYSQFDRQIRDELHARVSLAERLEQCPDFEVAYVLLADFDMPPKR